MEPKEIKSDQISSYHNVQGTEQKHKHHKHGKASGSRQVSHITHETKTAKVVDPHMKTESTRRHHHHSPEQLKGKEKEEYDVLKKSMQSNAKIRLRRDDAGNVSFALKRQPKKTEDRDTYFGVLPKEIRQMAGQFYTSQEKAEVAEGVKEMRGALGEVGPSLRILSARAKKMSKEIEENWMNINGRQYGTHTPQLTVDSYAVFDKEGNLKSITDSWEGGLTVEPGDTVIAIRKNENKKDYSPQELAYWKKTRPEFYNSLPKNDSKPAWEAIVLRSPDDMVKISHGGILDTSLKDAANPAVENVVRFLLDELNTSIANKRVKPN